MLGAGNVSAIVPLDIADRLINGGQVVICKMNPVNDYLGPIFEDIFAPLTRDRYLAFASTARRGRARGRIASRALADFGAGERHYLCGEPPDLLGRFLFEDQVDGVEPCPAANSAMIPAQAAGVVRIGWAPGPERGRPVV